MIYLFVIVESYQSLLEGIVTKKMSHFVNMRCAM